MSVSISIPRFMTAFLAVAILALAGPTAISAQEPVPVEPIENLEDEELQTFAEAYIEIMRVSQQAEAQLATVQDAEEAQAIQMQAQQQMQTVLNEHELQIDRYRRIGATINEDEEMAARFEEIVEELLEDGGGLV